MLTEKDMERLEFLKEFRGYKHSDDEVRRQLWYEVYEKLTKDRPKIFKHFVMVYAFPVKENTLYDELDWFGLGDVNIDKKYKRVLNKWLFAIALGEFKKEMEYRHKCKRNNMYKEACIKYGNEDWLFRANVGRCLNTSADVLAKLAKDEDWYVRMCVAENINTPVDIMMILYKDKDARVRHGIAANNSTPTSILTILSDDKCWNVRAGVAGNIKTPTDILRKLAKDDDWRVRESVANNLSTPADVLIELSEDKYSPVRMWIAKHPNTPIDVRMKLAEDKNEYVRYFSGTQL